MTTTPSAPLSVEQHKALVLRAIENFNDAARRAAYFDLYDPHCVFHGYPPGPVKSLEEVKQFYHGLWTAFPDAHVTVNDIIAEGGTVACRYTFRGTHRGAFMGIPPTGKTVVVRGMTMLRFTDGRCVDRRQNLDELSLLRQLGAIPAPG